MKLSRHPSLTWTLSSTLVLALTFGLTMFSGSAAAPGSNPPNGNIVPTFNSLHTTSDITADGTLYVGNGIKPKTGNSLTLDVGNTGNVSFTNSIEAIGKAIFGSVESKGDTTVAGELRTADITPKVGTTLNLNADTVQIRPAPYDTNGVVNPNYLTAGNLNIEKNTDIGGTLGVYKLLTASSGILSAGDATINGNITGVLNLKANSVDVTNGVSAYDITTTKNATIGGDADITGDISGTNVTATGTVTATGHLKAGSIGDFALYTFANGNGGNKVTVSPGNKGNASTLNCPATQVMLSCSLFSSQATLTPSVMMEIVYVAGKPIWKCSVDAYNAGASDADYYGSAVCFDPNG